MKVPNRVLKTALALVAEFNGTKASPPPSKEDVEFLKTWALEGTAKRTAMAATTKED